MSTKALQAKVIIEKPEQLHALWQVHSVFIDTHLANISACGKDMQKGVLA